jgi:hypothetical protein
MAPKTFPRASIVATASDKPRKDAETPEDVESRFSKENEKHTATWEK